MYIWGDNDPYYADANVLGRALFGARCRQSCCCTLMRLCSMSGNTHGDQTLSETRTPGQRGMLAHLITTGVENLYEGITIATIAPNPELQVNAN